MNNIIEQYYLDNNYPAADKLYKILKKKWPFDSIE